MELRDNIAIKYHLRIHKSIDAYPSELDISMDILFLLLDHNSKKRRKKIKGDLPIEMFQVYYNEMDEQYQPIVLEVFKSHKNQNHFEVLDNVIHISPDFINSYIK